MTITFPTKVDTVIMDEQSRMVLFYDFANSCWAARNHPSKEEIRRMPFGVQDAVKAFSAATLKAENKAYKARQKALGF